MTFLAIKSKLVSYFDFEPTQEQITFFDRFSHFLSDKQQQVLILKGYAGTGKTSLAKTIVKTLPHTKYNVVLLAPTGRAAKVLSNFSRKKAYTIHRYIYRVKNKDSRNEFILKENKASYTLYIVDEASMIANDPPSFSNKGLVTSLLDDLFRYIFHTGSRNKLLFIGDIAQLPPVHLEISPALQMNYLSFNYCKQAAEFELTEVVRQHKKSAIIENATFIREAIIQQINKFKLKASDIDFQRITDSYEVESALADHLNEHPDETLVIVRSNKRANLYNEQIRNRILLRDYPIEKGDKLMVVKNNYFWLDQKSKPGFIANGEVIEIHSVDQFKELYGFEFARVKVSLPDYPDEPCFNTILLLNTIKSETPGLSYEQQNNLYQNVLEDYAGESSKYKRFKKVKENPYFNALQVKYAYAVTCHKAQGGQWDYVFIEQPYIRKIDKNYLRWIYTAFTRAKKKVYLLGFKDEYFLE